MTDIDPRRYLLTQDESERIFREKIVPQELQRGVPQNSPVVVFVAGQPGAGKTMTTTMIKDELDARGGAIIVNSDFYKPFHPQYSRLLAEDDRTAAPYTSMDGRRWMALAEQYLIEHRIDAIIETTMRDAGDFAEPAAMFRAAGYRVEAAIMAVPEPLSRLGIVHRYHQQVQSLGAGRLTARSNHDASYEGVAAAARAIDRDCLVDVATVYRRGNQQLALNYLDAAGKWVRPNVSIARAIDDERCRPWTDQETRHFVDVINQLHAELGSEWTNELRDIAERALPLAPKLAPTAAAPPGRRIAAQAFPRSPRDAVGRRQPPGQTPRPASPGFTPPKSSRGDNRPGRGR